MNKKRIIRIIIALLVIWAIMKIGNNLDRELNIYPAKNELNLK